MRKIYTTLIFASSLSTLTAAPIEKFFPQAFKQEDRISVTPKMIAGRAGYQVDEFQDTPNRNHWDSRNDTPVKHLVMHYTVCDFPTTVRLFTKDVSDGRVSAHYVLTQKEEGAGNSRWDPFSNGA